MFQDESLISSVRSGFAGRLLAPPERVKTHRLGVEITPVTKPDLLRMSSDLVRSGTKHVIVGHNLHSAYLFYTDPDFRALYDRATIILADGKPIQADARSAMRVQGREVNGCERIGSTDWILDLAASVDGQRILVVGGSSSTNDVFISKLNEKSPHSDLLGLHGEFWESREADVLEQVRAYMPNLVIVGLGMPLQERFIESHFNRLPRAIYVLVGGAIDQVTGVQRMAPAWMRKVGLEWSWRLLTQPKRLGRRYLIEPWQLLGVLIRQRREG